MEPVSITFLVIGLTIVAAELGRMVKSKWKKHTQVEDKDGHTIEMSDITIDTSHMESGKHNIDDSYQPTPGQSAMDSLENSNITSPTSSHKSLHIAKLKVHTHHTHSSATQEYFSNTERGNSELATQLVRDILPGIISPTGAAIRAAAGVAKEAAPTVKGFFTKTKKTDDKTAAPTNNDEALGLASDMSLHDNVQMEQDEMSSKSLSDTPQRYTAPRHRAASDGVIMTHNNSFSILYNGRDIETASSRSLIEIGSPKNREFAPDPAYYGDMDFSSSPPSEDRKNDTLSSRAAASPIAGKLVSILPLYEDGEDDYQMEYKTILPSLIPTSHVSKLTAPTIIIQDFDKMPYNKADEKYTTTLANYSPYNPATEQDPQPRTLPYTEPEWLSLTGNIIHMEIFVASV